MRKAKEKTRQLLIHSSVTRVLVFASSIAILLVISLTFIANRVYADIITKEIFSTHKANLSFAQAHVEETLGKFSAINWFLLSDRDVVAFSQTSDKQLSWEGKMLYDKINALSESNILKNRITLLFNNPNKVIISDYGIFTPEIENDLSFFSHQEGNSVSNNMWYLSFTQNIPELIYRNTLVDSKGMEYAVCEIAIPVDEIGKIITRITADKNLAPFFLEGNTIALIKSHNTKLQVFEKKFTVPTPFTTVEEFLQGWNTQSSEYLQIKSSLEILTESIAFSQCKIGIVFDKDIALSPVSYANKIPLVLLVPLLLLGLTIALFVNRNIVRPLHNLVEPMKSMVESGFTNRVQEQGTDDIRFLFTNFNIMTERIQQLIQQNYAVQIANKSAQLEVLQSQINPHFLNNCMNFMYHSAQNQESKACAEMALYLKTFYGIATKPMSEKSTIEEEVGHALTYLHIFSMRFPKRLQVEHFIEADISQTPVLRLLLQPVVENCIVHGLQTCKELVKVTITGKHHDNYVTLTVRNSGPQIEIYHLHYLQQRLSNPKIVSDHIGLMNIAARLHLHYGVTNLVNISNYEQGVEVQIMIPLSKETSV